MRCVEWNVLRPPLERDLLRGPAFGSAERDDLHTRAGPDRIKRDDVAATDANWRRRWDFESETHRQAERDRARRAVDRYDLAGEGVEIARLCVMGRQWEVHVRRAMRKDSYGYQQGRGD